MLVYVPRGAGRHKRRPNENAAFAPLPIGPIRAGYHLRGCGSSSALVQQLVWEVYEIFKGMLYSPPSSLPEYKGAAGGQRETV